MPQLTLDPVAHHCWPDRFADHKADSGVARSARYHVCDKRWAGRPAADPDGLTKILAATHAILAGEQDSGSELRAAPAATGGKNRTSGASAHPQTEAVLLGATAIIRLKSAFGHE